MLAVLDVQYHCCYVMQSGFVQILKNSGKLWNF